MKRRFFAAFFLFALLLTLPCAAREPDEPVIDAVLRQEKQSLAEGLDWEYLLFAGTDGLMHEAYFLTVDMGVHTLLLATPEDAAANDGGGGKGSSLSDMAAAAAAHGKEVLAAVNGDFYKTFSDGARHFAPYASLGVMIKDGIHLSDGQQAEGAMYFGVTKDGEAVMGSAEPGGDWASRRSELYTAIGGELWLIHEGTLNWENIRWRTDSDTLRARYGGSGSALDENGAVRSDLSTHPRTCIGIRADGSVVLMCAALGYQSAGLDIVQAAQLMLDYGCVEAMNLDGGPSSQMLIRREDNLCQVVSGGISPRIGEGLLVVTGSPAMQPGTEAVSSMPGWLWLITLLLLLSAAAWFLLRRRSRR